MDTQPVSVYDLSDTMASPDFAIRARNFTADAMKKIIERLPGIAGVNPSFCPAPEDILLETHFGIYPGEDGHIEHHYGRERHFVASIGIPAAIYHLLGAMFIRWPANRHLDQGQEYLRALRKNGYDFRNFGIACREPEVLAFCAGMDDRDTPSLSPRIPEIYEEAYRMGKEAGKGLAPRKAWLSIALVADPAGDDIRFRVCFADHPVPHSDIDWYVRVFAKGDDDAKKIGEKIATTLRPPQLELMSYPMPQTLDVGNFHSQQCLKRIRRANRELEEQAAAPRP